MRRTIAVFAIVGLLAACGSDGGSASSGDGKEYVDAMMESYADGDAKDVFTESEARCVAEGVVDSVGVDKLQDAGIEPSDVSNDTGSPFEKIGKSLSKSEADDLVNVLIGGECFDFTDLVMKQASSGGSNPFAGVPEKKVRCLFDELLGNEDFKAAMANSLLGREGADDALSSAFGDQSTILDIMSTCNLTPNELSGT